MSSTPTPPVQEFDSYRDVYKAQVDEAINFAGASHDFFIRGKADYLTQLIENNFGKNEAVRALDVGCGHGFIHPHLVSQNKSLELFGVDHAASVIEVARENNPTVTYKAHDGKTLPFADDFFSVSYAICVMHHVPPPDWKDFLAEMKRVTKPNGLIVIFEHNPLNPLTLKVVNDCPMDKDAVLLRASTLKTLFREVGLPNILSKNIFFTPFDKGFFRWLDRRLGWMPFGAQYYVAARKDQ